MPDFSSGIVDFIFEAGQLKKVKRSGWWLANIKEPESVAEHSHRAAVIAFVLAKLEKEDANKLCSAVVFHDLHEARLLDVHKVAARYVETAGAGRKIESAQLIKLPKEVQDGVSLLYNMSEKEKELLKDADLLDMAFQAKEYSEQGYGACDDWMAGAEKRIKSKSAKELIAKLKGSKSTDWWQGLKKID